MGTVVARNFKFDKQFDHERIYRKNTKLGQNGREGSRDLLLEFWDPLYISGVAEGRNSKFSMRILTTRGNIEIMQYHGNRGRERLLESCTTYIEKMMY